MKTFYLLVFLTISAGSFAQQARMVIDLSPGAASTFGNDDNFEDKLQVAFDDKVLFLKRNSSTDKELWVSNGTAAGTTKLFGVTGSYWEYENSRPDKLYFVFKDENKFYFSSLDKNTLDTAIIMASNSYISDLTWFKDAYYFRHNGDLWKYDIAQNKTELVYDFIFFVGLKSIGVLDSQLIMIGGADNGTNLFKSDGTTAGTSEFHLLNDGSEFSGEEYFTQAGDLLFFFYYTPNDEKYRLYSTDGTSAGTHALVSLKRPSFSNLYDKRQIISWNNKLFFSAIPEGNPSNTQELYVSDGTINGTKILYTHEDHSYQSRPQFFTPYNGSLYFAGDWYSSWNLKIYKTDGTQQGTSLAIETTMQAGGYHSIDVFNDSLCFDAYKSNYGDELCFSNGTENGSRVIDVIPGSNSVNPKSFLKTDKYLFFTAKTANAGRELWVYDPDSVIVSNDVINQFSLDIFPNPCIDKIDFTGAEQFSSNDKVFFYSIDGQLALEAPFQKEIRVKDLKPGIYNVVIYTKKGTYSNLIQKE